MSDDPHPCKVRRSYKNIFKVNVLSICTFAVLYQERNVPSIISNDNNLSNLTVGMQNIFNPTLRQKTISDNYNAPNPIISGISACVKIVYY